jgi:hypothetical protein
MGKALGILAFKMRIFLDFLPFLNSLKKIDVETLKRAEVTIFQKNNPNFSGYHSQTKYSFLIIGYSTK